MTIRKKKVQEGQIVIDLTGPEGNAYNLLGLARRMAKTMCKPQEEIEAISAEMKSGDYENLLQVFDKHFGKFFILER